MKQAGDRSERGAEGEPSVIYGGSEEGFTCRPVVIGRRGVVTAGHYLAAMAGLTVLHDGGNAIDAGVCAGFCLAVLEPHNNGIGGESPILIHHARSGRTVAINGQGTAPAAASAGWFHRNGIRLIPGDGLLPATVPSQVDNWITALREFGTMNLQRLLSPAIELASEGFAVSAALARCIDANAARFAEEWPGSASIYLPGGAAPAAGSPLRNPDWAATFQELLKAERSAGGGREAGLEAARQVFYSGFIAERIADFCAGSSFPDASGRSNAGLLSYSDLASYRARSEEPVCCDYRGLTVHKCAAWTQGPVFLQQLMLLSDFDLAAMGQNSADYIHTLVECAKLAFADREYYYGDPDFVDVPLDRLLSPGYAEERRKLIDPTRASADLRPGEAGQRPVKLMLGDGPLYAHDTTHLDVVDAEGNMMAATPSGGWIQSSPVIPGLGFPLGTRGQMFSLDPLHPNCIEPGKRPRATLTPSLVTRDGKPLMVFGTPGGDQQDQWTLQFFLNHVVFGMGLQEALEAPTFHSIHFPSSFYPRTAFPRGVVTESRIPAPVIEELRERGHLVEVTGPWANGRVLAVRRDEARGLIAGGASPRHETGYAAGW